MLEKFLSDKVNVTKNAFLFLSRALCHHSFTFNSQSTWFISLKLCAEFSIFGFISFLLNFIFLLNKNSFQNKNIRKATRTVLLPDLWFLICNKKFENSMISEWVGAPKKLNWRRPFQLKKLKILGLYIQCILKGFVTTYVTYVTYVIM